MRLTLPSTAFGADSCCQLCQNQNEEKDDQRFQKNLFAKQRVGLQGFLLRQRLHYIPDSTGDQADQCRRPPFLENRTAGDTIVRIRNAAHESTSRYARFCWFWYSAFI